ncbi:ATP-binding protein [Geodermatophilus sp. SYSU D00710]
MPSRSKTEKRFSVVKLAELIDSDSLWNPYDFANPVIDETLFAGRANEVAEIQYYLRQAARAPRPINLVLTGARSSGKTSLLNKIEHLATARGMVVARVDLNESDTNPLAFFYKVYDSILLSAVTHGAFAGPRGQTYLDYRRTIDAGERLDSELLFPAHYAAAIAGSRILSESALKADLKMISTELGRPCVILFDECDVLAASRIELEMLRNIFMNTAGFMLVFAGTPNLFPVMEDIFSPIIRQFKKVPVARFDDRNDTIECITKPLRSLGISPAEVLSDDNYMMYMDVHRLSGGRPYEIQLLCHFMFRRIEERRATRMSITVDVLDDVRHELETQERGSGRRSIAELRRLAQSDLEALRLLTQFQGTVEELWLRARLFEDYVGDLPGLTAAAERLSDVGLLTVDEGRVTFRGDQFDEVYARYFAAGRDVELYITPWSFVDELHFRIRHLLDQIDGVRTLSADGEDDSETRLKLEEALAALTTGHTSSQALPDLATEQGYGIALAAEGGSLTLGLVQLTLAGRTVKNWIALSGSATQETVTSHGSMVPLAERASKLGGKLEAVFYSYPLPDRDAIRMNALKLASPAQRDDLAEFHIAQAYRLYETADFAKAAAEAFIALSIQSRAQAATMVVHLNLLAGRYPDALRQASQAVELANEEDDQSQRSIAAYDHAAALVVNGDQEGAVEILQELIEQDASTDPPAFLVLLQREDDGDWTVKGDRSVTPSLAAREVLTSIQGARPQAG